ncbi:hypothetical protein PQX77_017498 [Marasmius sp. AFHP31]|nr:hypothetical protein PQX77_017498 [Marasmius sp. AFHP31]
MDFGIDTPFSRVLNTNYSPSTEEQRSLRDLVLGPEEQIHRLDEEISRLQAKRQTLQQFVDLHRALLSPFRRIPADIWRLVFIKTLPENILGLCTRTTKSSPLLLTTVCRSWREIALSTPNLWTSIHVNLPIDCSNSPDLDAVSLLHKRKEGLKLWLDRSGTSLPISVSLAAETYTLNHSGRPGSWIGFAHPRAYTIGFIELLTQYSHRWGTVVFNRGVHLLDLTPLERLPASSLSSLESIHNFGSLFNPYRHLLSPNTDFPPSPLENLLTKAHSLRRLELFNANISAATLSLPVSWHHLTELSIILQNVHNPHESPLNPSRLLQILAAKCNSLATLNITLGSLRTTTASTISHPIQWPSLQALRIVFYDAPLLLELPSPTSPTEIISNDMASNNLTTFLPAIIQVFDSVTLPSLKKLSVAFDGSEPFEGHYAAQLPFEDLLERSQCPLTHFEMLHPRVVAVEAVIRVLRQLETLRALNMGYNRLTIREKDQRFGSGYSAEPPHRLTDPNVSSPWRRNWLDRFLQEFLLAEPDLNVELQGDSLAALPLCPRLEVLNIGGCALNDRDALLDFAMKTRRENFGTFRADLGQPVGSDVWKIFESLQAERQNPERMRVVQNVGAVTLDWRWDTVELRNLRPILDDPTTGLPDERSWCNDSLWL